MSIYLMYMYVRSCLLITIYVATQPQLQLVSHQAVVQSASTTSDQSMKRKFLF